MDDVLHKAPRMPKPQRTDTPACDSKPTPSHMYASAPLPSPTQQRPPFFAALTHASVTSTPIDAPQAQAQVFQEVDHAVSQQQYAHPQQQYAHPQQQQQQQQRQACGLAPQRAGSGSAETSGLIDRFGLVAEAAKRAQMAVLMRDLDAMEMA